MLCVLAGVQATAQIAAAFPTTSRSRSRLSGTAYCDRRLTSRSANLQDWCNSPMNLRIDLTDVAAHAIFNERFYGVQRVQIEISKVLRLVGGESSRIFANTCNFHRDLDDLFAADQRQLASDIYKDIRKLYRVSLPEGMPLRNGVANSLVRLRLSRKDSWRRETAFRLAAKDTLYVGGAFWADRRSVKNYERAARQGCDIVVLFHDLIPIDFPHLTYGRARPLFERMLKLPARAITLSQYCKARLEEARRAFGAPPGLRPAAVARLAHEFAGARRNQPAPRAPTARTAALEEIGAFVLCVGTIELRKNQASLLRLWESMAREFGEPWPKLVIAGMVGRGAEEAAQALRRGDPGSTHRWVEGPTDEELAWLYGRSRFTVFPSHAEGWGLPVGESLWFGKPCVASNTTSTPEVGGDLCSYADPSRIDSFARPIIRLVRDAEFYSASVAAIKASPLRTWAHAAAEIAALVSPAAG